MPLCSFRVLVHIVEMLAKPFPETFAGLANVLLPAPVHCAGDGIADVLAVAIQLGVQVHLIVGCRGCEGGFSYYIGADWTLVPIALFHALHYSFWSASWLRWNLCSD